MGRMCLFSAVHGVVLDHGRPVAGASIDRRYLWAWKNQDGGDQTTTDAQGTFALPAIWGRSLLGSLLPHEPFVEQTILIRHAGRINTGWRLDKRTYDENSELGDYDKDGKLHARPIYLVCRLDNEPSRHGNVYGICEVR